jgi:hypothetical protein
MNLESTNTPSPDSGAFTCSPVKDQSSESSSVSPVEATAPSESVVSKLAQVLLTEFQTDLPAPSSGHHSDGGRSGTDLR